MHVTVELHGDLHTYVNNGDMHCEIEVEDGATVGEVMTQLGIDQEAIWNAAVDGKLVYHADSLSDGAVLMVFPPLEGG